MASTQSHAVVAWSAPCPAVDPARILRVHGYTDPAKVRPVIARAAARLAKEADALAVPRAAWRRMAITGRGPGAIRLADGTELTCPAFDRKLAGAGDVALFVLTLGDAFDEAVRAMIEREETLDALFLESAGWLAIERLTLQLASDLRRAVAADGLQPGMRLGPGYSYRIGEGEHAQRAMWPLEQQRGLFAALGEAGLPVRLLESAAMLPKMSRSGLYGLVPAPA